jgi:hypothetical protein
MGQRSDQRSDVWQFGSILHELLYARRPEWGSGSKGIVLLLPAAPGASSFEARLGELCRDCLAQNPAERPANGMEVAARMAAAEIARPRGALARLVGRPRAILAAGLLLGIGAGGLLVDATIRHRLTRRELSPPAAPVSGAITDADRRFLQSLADTLAAQGRHQDAARLNRMAALRADSRP